MLWFNINKPFSSDIFYAPEYSCLLSQLMICSCLHAYSIASARCTYTPLKPISPWFPASLTWCPVGLMHFFTFLHKFLRPTLDVTTPNIKLTNTNIYLQIINNYFRLVGVQKKQCWKHYWVNFGNQAFSHNFGKLNLINQTLKQNFEKKFCVMNRIFFLYFVLNIL